MSRLADDPRFGLGVRSCHQGGRREFARDERGVAYVLTEMKALRACISKGEWEELLADLEDLIRAAESGELTFDSTYTKGVVCHAGGKVAGVEDVLEARIARTFNLDGRRRHLRLYFTEPSDFAGMLLLLGLQHKGDGELGLEEQNEHIREAQRRFDRWWREHYRPVGETM
ncbi:hypothetical protein BW737_014105 [Actinomyces ruminis]|uniref:Uncharacterized protein n=1 Tax=Actinomyces ruminis TaxID=1937003 RepID=A0ABX4M8M7_9ACTO|nr:hypothetical protein BW737_014105 [Actinomyces ruminis]